jgi:hypothetical protein
MQGGYLTETKKGLPLHGLIQWLSAVLSPVMTCTSRLSALAHLHVSSTSYALVHELYKQVIEGRSINLNSDNPRSNLIVYQISFTALRSHLLISCLLDIFLGRLFFSRNEFQSIFLCSGSNLRGSYGSSWLPDLHLRRLRYP